MTSKRPPGSRQQRCRRAPSCESAVSDPSSFRQSQSVTNSANGMNELGDPIIVNLLAQSIDIDFHEVSLAIEVAVPDMFDDFAAGDQFGSMEKEQLKEGKLLSR